MFALDEHWIVSPMVSPMVTRLVNGSAASTLPSLLPEEQREAGRDDAGNTVVPARHERRGQQSRERKIKEFERFNIPEILRVGIVVRQTGEGPMRTHFIMNAHRLTTLPDIKAEVANVKQAESAVMTKAGDAMDVDSFSKESPKGAPKRSR